MINELKGKCNITKIRVFNDDKQYTPCAVPEELS